MPRCAGATGRCSSRVGATRSSSATWWRVPGTSRPRLSNDRVLICDTRGRMVDAMRPPSSSGPAAVEYLAVVALVAIVFVVAGAFVLNGRAIAAATVAQIRRGLCIVEGHDCADPHAPCSVSSHGSGDELHVVVAIVRFGGGSAALVERRSDGKVAVTVTDHLDVGASAGVGSELRAAALASRGHGATYEVADERQAAALLRLLHRPKVDPSLYTSAVRAYWHRVSGRTRSPAGGRTTSRASCRSTAPAPRTAGSRSRWIAQGGRSISRSWPRASWMRRPTCRSRFSPSRAT